MTTTTQIRVTTIAQHRLETHNIAHITFALLTVTVERKREVLAATFVKVRKQVEKSVTGRLLLCF